MWLPTDVFFIKKQLDEAKIACIRALNAIAEQRGETLAQMALKWIMKDRAVTSVLIGASRPEQILDNLKILEGGSFSEEELTEIDRISKPCWYWK